MNPPNRLPVRLAIVLTALLATVPFLGSGAADLSLQYTVPDMHTPDVSTGGCFGVHQYIEVRGPVTILGQASHMQRSGPVVDTWKEDYGLFLYDDNDGTFWYYWMYGTSGTARCIPILVDHIQDTAACAMATSPAQWVQWASSLTPDPNVPGVDGEPVMQEPPCDVYWTP